MDEVTDSLRRERDQYLCVLKKIRVSISKINAFSDKEAQIKEKENALQEINEILEVHEI